MTKQIDNHVSTLSVHPGELAGQVALVTGGGRGIGRATAQALAAAGASVVITSRSQIELNQTLALIEKKGGHGLAIVADITDQDAVEQLTQLAEAQWGPVDLLVNNAGSSVGLGRITDVDPKQWWLDVTTSVYGAMLTSHAVLQRMVVRRRGRIINVASRIGTVPFPFFSSYAIGKTALIRFTEALDLEVRDLGICTFAIHPGEVHTQLTPKKDPDGLLPDKVVENYRQQLHDTPELGASLISFLATGRADALSGCFISAHDDLLAMIERAETIQSNHLQRLRLSV
jgi:NAD(P)-dependent dehydrogenase (short-subunit alcohol dehydrogenase family)